MGSAPKLRYVDRAGTPFSPRYHTAISRLSRVLWQNYPYVRDKADRDDAEEETLRRVAGYEQEHGEAENLPALIRRFFPQVAFRKFVRQPHPSRYEESRNWQDLEALSTALRDSSSVLENHIHFEELLRNLNPRERHVLSLLKLGHEAETIADALNVSTENIYQIIHRAVKHLKRAADE